MDITHGEERFCDGCIYSFAQSGNDDKCPFCNSDQSSKTVEDHIEDNMKRVEANDAGSICLLATSYHLGLNGFQQDQTTAMELYAREQILVIVRRIIAWLLFIIQETQKRPSSTLRPPLWQETKWYGAILEQCRHSLETWNELQIIGQLLH
jgi:hypothetical protein